MENVQNVVLLLLLLPLPLTFSLLQKLDQSTPEGANGADRRYGPLQQCLES